jgi:hypothetical protein
LPFHPKITPAAAGGAELASQKAGKSITARLPGN